MERTSARRIDCLICRVKFENRLWLAVTRRSCTQYVFRNVGSRPGSRGSVRARQEKAKAVAASRSATRRHPSPTCRSTLSEVFHLPLGPVVLLAVSFSSMPPVDDHRQTVSARLMPFTRLCRTRFY